MKNTNRCVWIDTAKGIAIFLVVLGHSVQYYLCKDNYEDHFLWKFIYSFHMPFFFILSGYVIGLKPLSLKVKNKFCRLLIPYASWAVINFVVMSVVQGICLDRIFNYVYTPSNGGLWYLWALFFIYIIHALIIEHSRTQRTQIFLFLISTGVLAFASKLISGHFGLSEISKYFPYYVIGYYLGNNSFLHSGIKVKHIVLPIMGGVIFLFFYNVDNCVTIWITRFGIALSLSILFMIISRLLSDSLIESILKKIAIHTLGIYAMDTYFIVFVSMCTEAIWFWPIAVIMDITITYSASFLLSRNKISAKYLLGIK